MKPRFHTGCNFVYRGPTPEIGDLHVFVNPKNRIVEVVYELDDDDRKMIAEGGTIRLGIHQAPIPPVSLNVAPVNMYPRKAEHLWKEIPELREREDND